MADELPKIIRFLLGESDYAGHWFGDKPDVKAGAFWWRKYLREWAASIPHRAPAAEGRTECTECDAPIAEDEPRWCGGCYIAHAVRTGLKAGMTEESAREYARKVAAILAPPPPAEREGADLDAVQAREHEGSATMTEKLSDRMMRGGGPAQSFAALVDDLEHQLAAANAEVSGLRAILPELDEVRAECGRLRQQLADAQRERDSLAEQLQDAVRQRDEAQRERREAVELQAYTAEDARRLRDWLTK